MANSSRPNLIRLLAFTALALVPAGCHKAPERPPAAEQMSKAY